MRRIIDALLAAQMPVLSWWGARSGGDRASATLSILSIFMLGAWLHIQGLATVGEIVTFINFATMLIGRLEQMVGFVNSLFMQAGRVGDFFEVIDTTPGVADRPGAMDPGRLTGRVTPRKSASPMTASARRWTTSLCSRTGRNHSPVGSTGSGKSTTMSLLHRVFDPTEGSICIDGIDIRDMTLQSLRRNIGVVFQEPMLFAFDQENLRVGKPDATAENWRSPSSGRRDFVARQTEGLNSKVGERGRAVGRRAPARIDRARPARDPPLMIFDEATSALDATTERQIQAALDAATKGRTTFVIAHRPATIRNANRIPVFDAGKVVESGTSRAGGAGRQVRTTLRRRNSWPPPPSRKRPIRRLPELDRTGCPRWARCRIDRRSHDRPVKKAAGWTRLQMVPRACDGIAGTRARERRPAALDWYGLLTALGGSRHPARDHSNWNRRRARPSTRYRGFSTGWRVRGSVDPERLRGRQARRARLAGPTKRRDPREHARDLPASSSKNSSTFCRARRSRRWTGCWATCCRNGGPARD